MSNGIAADQLFTSGALRQAARAGWAACEGNEQEARVYATAARHEFSLDKGEPEPPGFDAALAFIVENYAPTYMEMEDLVRSLDARGLDKWEVRIVSRMRAALLEVLALREGLFYRPGIYPATAEAKESPPMITPAFHEPSGEDERR